MAPDDVWGVIYADAMSVSGYSLPNFRIGQRLSADDLNKIVAAIERNQLVAGQGSITTRGIIPRSKRKKSGGASVTFSGTAYVSGKKTTGLTSDSSKPWVKIVLSTGVATEDLGPPPDPFPDNTEYYEKAYTFGDIHIPRVG